MPKDAPSGKRLQVLIGNHLWNNGIDALTAGGGDSQVRAGVLRLLDSVPEIDVEKSKTGGKPTLTLTADSVLFGDGAPPAQVLTIDAKTGAPISLESEASPGNTASKSTYQVTRVSLADVKAGKF